MTKQAKQTSTFFLKPFLVLTFSTIVPIGIITYITYQSTVNHLSNQIVNQLQARAEGIARHFDVWMETNIKMMRQNASLDDIISMNPHRQKPILKSIIKEYKKWANTAHVTAPNGWQVTRADEEELKDLGDRDYIQQALKGFIGANVAVSRTYGKPTILIGVPIYDNTKKIIGVLSMGSYVSSISEFMTDTKFGQSGHTYLLNQQGRIVAHPNMDLAQGVADFSKHPILVELGTDTAKKVIFYDYRKDTQTIAFVHRSQYGWIAVAQQNYDEAFKPLVDAKRTILIIFSIITILIILISFFLAKYLTNLVKTKIKSLERFNFIPRLLLTIVMLTALTLGTYWTLYYQHSISWVIKQADEQLNIRSNNLTAYIDSWLEMHFKILHQTASNKNIQSMESKKQKSLLQSITKEYSWISAAQVIRPNGQAIISNLETLKNYSDQNWFKNAFNSDISHTAELITDKTTPLLALTTPIKDNKQKIIGTMLLLCTISNITDAIRNIKLDNTALAYLFTDKGKLLAYQERGHHQALLNFNPLLPSQALKKANKIIYTDSLTNKKILAQSQKDPHGWTVVVQQDYDEVLKPIHQNIQQTFRIALISLFLALIVTLLVTRNPNEMSLAI